MNSVRPSRLLSQSFTLGSEAKDRIDRLPSARGPYSNGPSNRATTFPLARTFATSLATSVERTGSMPARRAADHLRLGVLRTQVACFPFPHLPSAALEQEGQDRSDSGAAIFHIGMNE